MLAVGLGATLSVTHFTRKKEYPNPYLDEFNQLPKEWHRSGPLMRFAEHTMGKEFAKTRLAMVTHYAWAVPNDEALNAIAEAAEGHGLVDFGAGTGYWAKLLADRGVDVVAIDNWTDQKPEKLWFPVITGSYELLPPMRDRVLFLCWPPQGTTMALNALKVWGGNTLVYVGEPAPSPGYARSTADPSFLMELLKHWDLEQEIEIPRWFNRDDSVFIYHRKLTP